MNEHIQYHHSFHRRLKEANERIEEIEHSIATATDFDAYKRLQADLEDAQDALERLEFDKRVSSRKLDELRAAYDAAQKEFIAFERQCQATWSDLLAAKNAWAFAADKVSECEIKLRRAQASLDSATKFADQEKARLDELQADYDALIAAGIIHEFMPYTGQMG